MHGIANAEHADNDRNGHGGHALGKRGRWGSVVVVHGMDLRGQASALNPCTSGTKFPWASKTVKNLRFALSERPARAFRRYGRIFRLMEISARALAPPIPRGKKCENPGQILLVIYAASVK